MHVRRSMAKILSVDKDSYGDRLGIKAGQEIIAFDGEPFVDILDYSYYDCMSEFDMTIGGKFGEHTYHVNKGVDESLGLNFGHELDLAPMRCRNKCQFCFVDQLPKGMRETLYIKDDDYRMSFVCGNYVTLTNVGQKELDRIARMKLSPLYISVHAYDRDIKTQLIKNPEGAKLFDKIDFLSRHGITMHTQIVMCNGINDGDVLMETLHELARYYPSVQSVAIVPVGLTQYRDNLAPLVHKLLSSYHILSEKQR